MSMIITISKGEQSLSRAEYELPHVLLVVDQLPQTLGGGERIALKLADLLPEYGYRVSILTFSAYEEAGIFRSVKCPIYLLPLRRTYDFTAFRAAIRFRQFLRQHRIQIVQTFFESSDLWAGLLAKSVPNVKLIWSRRDMGILRDRKHQVAYRLMANVPDAVFAVSNQVRQYCIEVDGINHARIQTIYNGLNIDDWNPDASQSIDRGTVHITTVGNIRRVKGHDIFIKAAALIVPLFPEVTFSIAGEMLEQDYFLELQALIRDLNLCGRIRFVGAITDLKQHLCASDIFVLPSRSEGFSNAIIEAMAASLPVVATDVGGNAEAVQENISGFIVSSENPEMLSAAIIRLLADPAHARAMGKAGRRIVGERFTTEAMMRQISTAYSMLLLKN